MPNLDEIIAEAKRTLTCPVCGRRYENAEIKLRGFLDNAYIIQTICSNGHPPLITMFVATTDAIQPVTPNELSRSKKSHISFDDVLKAHQQIKTFNGSFSKLWEKQ